jgi:hypothetical protein
MNTTVFAIWINFGLIAAAIYRSKDRFMLLAFVAGLLLGPFAILLALVSGRSVKGLAQQQGKEEAQLLKAGKLKKCPQFAELIRPDASVCKFWHSPV